MKRVWLYASMAVALASPSLAADPAPLALETKISLGDVRGRIDHLAVDLGRQRLFVAELGNNSVGVVDLKEGKVIQTITGLQEPQGDGYAAPTEAQIRQKLQAEECSNIQVGRNGVLFAATGVKDGTTSRVLVDAKSGHLASDGEADDD